MKAAHWTLCVVLMFLSPFDLTDWRKDRMAAMAQSPTPPPQCLYAADLTLSTSDYAITSEGHLLAFDQAQQLIYNESSIPTSLAVDHRRNMLYIGGLGTVLGLDIAHNLTEDSSLCPCATTNDLSTILGMAADERDGSLFVAYRNEICHFYPNVQLIQGCYSLSEAEKSAKISTLVVDTKRNRLYAAPQDRLSILVYTILSRAPYLRLDTVWMPASEEDAIRGHFRGLVIGANGNLFANLPPFILNLTVLVELDVNDGHIVNQYVPTTSQFSQILDFYDLAYEQHSNIFYSYFHLNTTSELIIGAYQLTAGSNGQFGETTITRFSNVSLRSPLGLQWARCPFMAASPSPSPPASEGTNSGPYLAIALSIGLPLIVLAFIVCCLAMIWWLWIRRRRRYYQGGNAAEEVPEEDMELNSVKYTYREIEFADLTIGRELGHGAFGRVYRGEYRGAAVAIKMLENVRLQELEENTLRELRKEAEMMEKLSNHPNIVKFVGAITKASGEANTFALVTEYCSRGSLYDLLIRKGKKLPLITLVRMARDIASGVLHLHKEHVVHRDLACRNILVGANYEVYVADFGLARTKEAGAQAGTTKQSFGPIAWMAPEALGNLEYSEATDSYSYGVLLWEMVARKRPWAGLETAQIVASVTSNVRPQIPSDCDPMFKKTIKQCWKHNPAKRPTFDKIVKNFTEYHKQLKKIMNFDNEEDSDDSDSDSDDLLDTTQSGGGDLSLQRMKGELRTLMQQYLYERSDQDFSAIERINLETINEIKTTWANKERLERLERQQSDSNVYGFEIASSVNGADEVTCTDAYLHIGEVSHAEDESECHSTYADARPPPEESVINEYIEITPL